MLIIIMDEGRVFKCDSCKIKKPISHFRRKPNIRYHYHTCKDCNVKDHIKELVVLKKIAQMQNKTYNEVLIGCRADSCSDEYDDIMVDYIPLNSNINVYNEGEILHGILFDLYKSRDIQF